MEQTKAEIVTEFHHLVISALNRILVHHHFQVVDDDSHVLAKYLVEFDSDLEGYAVSDLLPMIERWQMIERIKRGVK